MLIKKTDVHLSSRQVILRLSIQSTKPVNFPRFSIEITSNKRLKLYKTQHTNFQSNPEKRNLSSQRVHPEIMARYKCIFLLVALVCVLTAEVNAKHHQAQGHHGRFVRSLEEEEIPLDNEEPQSQAGDVNLDITM